MDEEQRLTEIKEKAKRFNDLLVELAGEHQALLNGRDRAQLSQPERRMFVRSAFATIEAWIFVMKQAALAGRTDPKPPPLLEAEWAFADEQEYKLSSDGEVKMYRAKIPLETNVKFAFKLLAKASATPAQLDLSVAGWHSFTRAIKVRDRITHPKSIPDLNISDEDFEDVATGFVWLITTHALLGAAIVNKANSEKAGA